MSTLDFKHDLLGALIGAGTAASLPDEMGSLATRVLVGALTGLMSMGLSALIRKLFARKL